MYEEWQAKAIKTLLELPIGKDRTYAEVDSEVGEMIFTAQEMSWVKMEWFQNIKPREFADEMEGVEAGDGAAQSRNGKSNGLLSGGSDYIGLGTMMQDATDYLGERQQEDYRRWKAKVMARVQEVEAT
jgi:origin recognition complex subunit 6